MNSLISEEKKTSRYDALKRYNSRLNCAVVANETVFHCHVHLISRKETWKILLGGVRPVINGRVGYW